MSRSTAAWRCSAASTTRDTWLRADRFASTDVAPSTLSQYRSFARNHILPRWGDTRLNKISGIAVAGWTKKLRSAGYASATVTTILKVMSMMLADAVDERLIPANPVRPKRRGRRHHEPTTEAVWVTPEQAVQVALNAVRLVGPAASILMLTAAWTGARWGELTGLHRDDTHVHAAAVGKIVIDPKVGALHEVDGQFYLGPPKTAESARTITLLPFLTELLRHHLAGHPHSYVFVSLDGNFLRRSNFSRRAMRPQPMAPPTYPARRSRYHPPHQGLRSTGSGIATRHGSSPSTSPTSRKPDGSATASLTRSNTSTATWQPKPGHISSTAYSDGGPKHSTASHPRTGPLPSPTTELCPFQPTPSATCRDA